MERVRLPHAKWKNAPILVSKERAEPRICKRMGPNTLLTAAWVAVGVPEEVWEDAEEWEEEGRIDSEMDGR